MALEELEDGDYDLGDSLDRIERLMALEEALIANIHADPSLTPAQREALIRQVEAQIDSGEFPEEGDWGDDALGVLVRKLGPRGPLGRSGAAVRPELEVEDTGNQAFEPRLIPQQPPNRQHSA